jgi:asparagine synthase (glutamine-hydrolysing)
MCGILGQVSERQEDLDSWTAAEAIASLRHRGPDGDGAFEDRARAPACRLVHTRLAIIDTSEGGQQPMASPDGRHVLIYNGEIYNHVELREELVKGGERFASTSDTEVLLRAFVLWGPACLERLRGMFAFAIWDRQQRSLFIARDRLGIKPLYMSHRGGSFSFASEVRALLRTRLVDPVLSRAGVEAFLSFGSVWGRRSMVEGIEELPPGTLLEFREGKVREQRYWQLPVVSNDPVPRSRAEAVDAIAPRLREAVRLQLRSDVRIGVFLSAGIDSGSVAALATELVPGRLTTLTVSFSGSTSEGREAEQTARHLHTDHREVLLPPTEAAQWVPRAVADMDQPSVDGLNTWVVSRAARREGLRVALSGLGGDEVFAGYRTFRSFPRLLRFAPELAPLGSLGAWALGRTPFTSIPMRLRKAAWVARSSHNPASLYGALRCLFTPDQASALWEGHPGFAPVVAELEGTHDRVNLLSRLELQNYLRSTLLRDADSMSMAHGLEVRPPLLDEQLCNEVLPLPGRLKLAPRVNKPLLVGCTEQLLPPAIKTRPKTGFSLPLEEWLEGPLKEWHHEGLQAAFDLGFRKEGWESLVAGRREGPSRVDSHRWLALAVLGHWARQQGIRS